MKKAVISLLPVAAGLVLGCYMIMFLAALFSLIMTYDKRTNEVAGRDYVREVTRWAGHKHVVNIPVYYGD